MAAKSFYVFWYNPPVNKASHITEPDLLLLLFIFLCETARYEKDLQKTVIIGFPADLSVHPSALEIGSVGRETSSCQE